MNDDRTRPGDEPDPDPDPPAPVGWEQGGLPTALIGQPWFDAHNHAHTLSWADRERFAVAGCRGMVMVASGTHWIPSRPIRPDQYRFLWEQALARRPIVERQHGYAAGLSVGVQTGVRVTDPESLLDALPEYCAEPSVLAVGETGIRPTQQGEPWPLADQRAVVERQMAIAADAGLPVILHTPSELQGPGVAAGSGPIHGYESDRHETGQPVLDGADANLEAVRIDVRAAAAAGLSENRVVASHADATNAPYLLEETDCYVSVTLGNSWLTGVTVDTVAELVDRYGPERIMLDTDAANVMRSDVLAVKRAMLGLHRRGIDADAIRRIVAENPRTVFGFDE